MNSSLLNSLKLKYTNIDHFNILIITWNVGAKIENKESLRNLIFNHLNKHAFDDTNTSATTTISSQSPEIVVFGLQEMVELSTSNVIGMIEFLNLI